MKLSKSPLLPLAGLAAAAGLYVLWTRPAATTNPPAIAGALPSYGRCLDPNSDDGRAVDTIAKIAAATPSALKPDAVRAYAGELASEGYQADAQRLLSLLPNA